MAAVKARITYRTVTMQIACGITANTSGRGTQKARQTMRRHKRENQILKGLISAAAAVAICIAGLILFFVFVWWRAQNTEPTTDEEVAALMQRQQAEPLVIETPEPATEGSITIYTPDGTVYGYFGDIDIISDGRDGSQINIVLTGWLVGKRKKNQKASENMYTWKNGNYQHVGANIQKSIKIDTETLEIIEAVNGRSFSDKVRNMAAEYIRLKCDELTPKK